MGRYVEGITKNIRRNLLDKEGFLFWYDSKKVYEIKKLIEDLKILRMYEWEIEPNPSKARIFEWLSLFLPEVLKSYKRGNFEKFKNYSDDQINHYLLLITSWFEDADFIISHLEPLLELLVFNQLFKTAPEKGKSSLKSGWFGFHNDTAHRIHEIKLISEQLFGSLLEEHIDILNQLMVALFDVHIETKIQGKKASMGSIQNVLRIMLDIQEKYPRLWKKIKLILKQKKYFARVPIESLPIELIELLHRRGIRRFHFRIYLKWDRAFTTIVINSREYMIRTADINIGTNILKNIKKSELVVPELRYYFNATINNRNIWILFFRYYPLLVTPKITSYDHRVAIGRFLADVLFNSYFYVWKDLTLANIDYDPISKKMLYTDCDVIYCCNSKIPPNEIEQRIRLFINKLELVGNVRKDVTNSFLKQVKEKYPNYLQLCNTIITKILKTPLNL